MIAIAVAAALWALAFGAAFSITSPYDRRKIGPRRKPAPARS